MSTPGHSRQLAMLAGVALVLAALCGWVLVDAAGKRATGSAGYDDAVRANVVGACERSGVDEPAECECAWERLVAEVPFEEFRRLDDAYEPGDPVPERLADIAASCAEP